MPAAQMISPGQAPPDPIVDLSNAQDVSAAFRSRSSFRPSRANENIQFLDMSDPFKDFKPLEENQTSFRFVTRDRFPKEEMEGYQGKNTIDYFELRAQTEKLRSQQNVERAQPELEQTRVLKNAEQGLAPENIGNVRGQQTLEQTRALQEDASRPLIEQQNPTTIADMQSRAPDLAAMSMRPEQQTPATLADMQIKAPDLAAMSLQDLHSMFEKISKGGLPEKIEQTMAFNNSNTGSMSLSAGMG